MARGMGLSRREKERTPPEKPNLAWIDRGWSTRVEREPRSRRERRRGSRGRHSDARALERRRPRAVRVARRARASPHPDPGIVRIVGLSSHAPGANLRLAEGGPAHASAGAAAGQDAATRRRRHDRARPRGGAQQCVLRHRERHRAVARSRISRGRWVEIAWLALDAERNVKQRGVVRVSSCAERVARGRVDAWVLVRRCETDVRGRTHACLCVVSDVRAGMPVAVRTRGFFPLRAG